MTITTEKPIPLEVRHATKMVCEAIREIMRKQTDKDRRAAILVAFHAAIDTMAATLEAKLDPKGAAAKKPKKVAGDV